MAPTISEWIELCKNLAATMQQVTDLTRRVSVLESRWDWIIALLVANLVSILVSTWAAFRDRKALASKSNGNGVNK